MCIADDELHFVKEGLGYRCHKRLYCSYKLVPTRIMYLSLLQTSRTRIICVADGTRAAGGGKGTLASGHW